jgi:hypothetical protein
MLESSALHAALALLKDPVSVRKYHRAELPSGIRVMLAIAGGNEDAIRQAQQYTGQPRATLQEAAAFFVEQVLLAYDSDSYRVLGGTQRSSHEELRRNMALLMRWLHPDLQGQGNHGAIDREVFSNRVTRAWEDLKTEERRRAYDRKHPPAAPAGGKVARKPIHIGVTAAAFGSCQGSQDSATADLRSRRGGKAQFHARLGSPLCLRKLQGDPLWVRLIKLFKSRS